MPKRTLNTYRLHTYLNQRLGASTGTGPEYQFYCPFCVDRVGSESGGKKLWINFTKGCSVCYRCGFGARSLTSLFKQLNGGRLLAEESALLSDEITEIEHESIRDAMIERFFAGRQAGTMLPHALPKESKLLYPILRQDRKPRAFLPAVRYLRRRRISLGKIRRFKIGFAPRGDYGHRLVFPIFHNRKLVYFTTRYCGDHEMKSKNPMNRDGYYHKKDVIFNYDDLVGRKRIAICEGPFDVMAHHHAGGLLGKTISDEQVQLIADLVDHGLEEVVVSLDAGEMRASTAVHDALIDVVPRVSVLPLAQGDPDENRAHLEEMMTTRRAPTVRDRILASVGRA